MKIITRALSLACAGVVLVSLCPSLAEDMPVAEDMPIVVDQPFSEEELAEIEAEQARQRAHVQQVLIDLGYLVGAADGVFGPRTTQAIKDFQYKNGLAATGTANDETLALLEEMAATAAESKELQQRLIDLGYLRGTADGIFGERSQAALKLFQALQGLEATGKLDDATRELLFAETTEALPTRLPGGSKGERVEALQNRLIQYGFMSGTADGSYGPKTSAAVTRFQKHLQAQGYDETVGIVANGEASSATLALLYRESYSTYLRDLEAGEQSSEALRVERRLNALGYMDMEPKETLDDYAVRAAAAFQAAAGLGEAMDKAFIDALFSENAPVAQTYVPHAIAAGDRSQAVRAVENALMLGGISIKLPNGRYDDSVKEAVEKLHDYLVKVKSPKAELFADPEALSEEAQQALSDGLLGYTADVSRGSSGAEAKRVQSRLYSLYYISKFGIDGNFGSGSVEALQSFQRANGLGVTGIADAETQKALFSEGAAQNPRPYRVEVDIDNQRVYVFERQENGDYEKTHTFICSTGLGNLTPRGVYLDGYPVNRWHYFEKYNCWAQYSFEVEGNIMLHSVIYSEANTNTLRESSLYGLGQKASHGCIRLKVADAKWLFEHCSRGSLVIVIY